MSTCKIDVYPVFSKITGEFPLKELKLATSYPVEGAQYSPAFRKGRWDGRKHLMTRTRTFPSGLLEIVEEALVAAKVSYEVEDHRVEPEILGSRDFDLIGVSHEYPYDYQKSTCEEAIKHKRGVIKSSTGSGKTNMAASITKYIGRPTLFVVPTMELMHQSRARFQKLLGLGDEEVGIIGDGEWSPGSLVTIAIVHTLNARKDTVECRDFLSGIDVLFLDEAHRCGSDSWYDISLLTHAFWRYGLSGTPMDRTDGANLRLIGITGRILVDISNKFLVDRGIVPRANILFDSITEPKIDPKTKYAQVYKDGVSENAQLHGKVIEWVDIFVSEGLSVLVLCEDISQGNRLADSLLDASNTPLSGRIPHTFIHGKSSSEDRKSGIEDFDQRRLPVLIASVIADEGLDVYAVDALILTGSRESTIRTKQRLGRGLRGDKLIAVEFANFCHRYLMKHSLTRLEDYKNEECFPIHYPPVKKEDRIELVRRVWEEQNPDKWTYV